mgnify:CR=1 FL=1
MSRSAVPRTIPPIAPAGTLAALEQPVLGLGDARLRPWEPADAPAVREAYTDPAIQRWHVRTLTAAEAEAWVGQWPGRWARETGAGWAIAREPDGVLLGQIALRRIDLEEGDAEISYWVVPAARGRKLAPRALTALTGWVFGTLGLHRIEVRHSTANEPSCRVAESAAFPYEGTLRSQALHDDGWHDMHVHARINAG